MATDSDTSKLSRRNRLPAKPGIVIVIISIAVGLATYTILTGLTWLTPTRDVIITLLIVNLSLVLVMVAMIAWQGYMLWQARRHDVAGSRLHVRLVLLFAVVAALPALVVAIFATVTLDRGLDTWFSERTRQIVDTAVTVAWAYMAEQREILCGDAITIVLDINRQRKDFKTDLNRFTRRLASHARWRGLASAYVIIIDSTSRRVASSVTANSSITFRPPPQWAINRARNGELVIVKPNTGSDNVIRALIRLSNFDNAYLYISRFINPMVFKQLEQTRQGKTEYDAMQAQRYGVQITFALMYIGVCCVFLLASIWFGLWFADRLAQPIMRLVDAARQVSFGAFDVKVPVHDSQGDLATLGRTFNSMTAQLASQRNALINANTQLDARRHFIETVLSGVSAGVMGLDGQARITIVNRSTLELLHLRDRDLLNRPLKQILPDVAKVLDKALRKPSGTAEGHIDMHVGGETHTFIVRATTQQANENGHVVTFDDMTDLVFAQRNSAWADIARRIAHEIKNPLTPIHLSAERLRRKYGKEIKNDVQVFEQCIDTIIRQVGDIGRMIDEFSSFARMPKARLNPCDLMAIIRQSAALQRVLSNDITIELNLCEKRLIIELDRQLMTQVMTNLIKNAREAVEAKLHMRPEPKGRIVVHVHRDEDHVIIDIADNGIGLPRENRKRLLEPYATTRNKGTGLGLAIVARIVEEHGGEIVLRDAPENLGGALIRLTLPVRTNKTMSEDRE